MIKSLQLENYRNHTKSEINFDKVNWMVGLSGAGKSSILGGIETAASALNEWTKNNGAGKDTQIKNGQKKATINMVLQEAAGAEVHIRKSIPRAKGDTGEWQDSEIVQACLRSRHLIHLPDNIQKEIFFSIIPAQSYDIFQELDAWNSKFPDLGQRFQRYIEGEGKTTDNIDKLYEIAYDDRRLFKRELENEQKKTLPEKPEFVRDVKQADVDKARKQYEEAIKKLAHAEEKESSRMSVYRKDLAAWQILSSRHTSAQKELSDAEEDVQKCVAEIGASIDYDAQVKEIEKRLTESTEAIKKHQQLIDKYTGDEPCPPGTCARMELKKLNEKMKELQSSKEAVLAESRSAIYNSNQAAKKKERAQAANARWERAKKAYDELPKLPTEPKPPSQEQTKGLTIEQMRNQVNMFKVGVDLIESELRKAEKVLEIIAQESEKKEAIEELSAQVEMFEVLVEALGPGGIKTRKLEAGAKKLEHDLVEKLMFFGMTCQISVEPWQIYVSYRNGMVPVQQLSWSEKARVSACIQSLVAQRTGFGIVGIDEHGLDPEHRPELLDFLLRQPVQSIVLSTLVELDDAGNVIIPGNPEIPGVKIFYVENGAVKEILPEAQAEAA